MNNANNNTVTDTNLNEILTQAIEQMKEIKNGTEPLPDSCET